LEVLIFTTIKKLPHIKFHGFKSIDLFGTSMITNSMIRSRFEDIFKYIHLVDNKSIITNKDDSIYNKIAKTRWFVETCNQCV